MQSRENRDGAYIITIEKRVAWVCESTMVSSDLMATQSRRYLN
ncbi:hypothetical protein BFV93_4699 [Alteromonas macleodii]|nr:hypothetical protein BFV93_4699 [Alteromonas macleodii]